MGLIVGGAVLLLGAGALLLFIKGQNRIQAKQKTDKEVAALRAKASKIAEKDPDRAARVYQKGATKIMEKVVRKEPDGEAWMKATQDLMSFMIERSQRFRAASTIVRDPHFLDVTYLIEKNDWNRQQTALKRYEQEARSMLGFPNEYSKKSKAILAKYGLKDDGKNSLGKLKKDGAFKPALFKTHARYAQLCSSLMALLKAHQKSLMFDDEGGVNFKDPKAEARFHKLFKEIEGCEKVLFTGR